ncbi:MAG TPA: sigma-70 family RNA polymerase sigma factor [Gemmatimonadales bacterium]|nr:sigma-70 family RNA polymerase sigma factor [Gemmatimonadales bacterium]
MSPLSSGGPRFFPLLEAARAGGDRELEQLLKALYAPLQRWAIYRAPVPHDLAETFADDIVAETIGRVAGALSGCRAQSEGAFLAWMFTIAQHVAIDHLRSHSVEVLRVCTEAERLLDQAAGAAAPCAGVWGLDSEDVELAPEEAALAALLLEAYLGLPEDTGAVLWDAAVRGMNWAEIAEEIRTTPNRARRRYQRGRVHLRRATFRALDQAPPGVRMLALAALARRAVQAQPPESDL